MDFVNRGVQGHFRKNRCRIRPVLLGCWIVLTCFADIVWSERGISDEKKKEAVYRMYTEYKKDFSQVKDISVRQSMELLKKKSAIFVDIRKPAEMAVSMLPGAVNQQQFLSHINRYKNKAIIAYCTISYRSGMFARQMAEQGITILNLQGGILAWILEGGKVYDASKKEVKRVHVFGDNWDYAPVGYQSIKFGLWEKMF
jgi:rhodanese-related sulfurtransferase